MKLVVDISNIAYRSFHTPQSNLSTREGEPTGVMLGILNSLKMYIDKFQNVSKIVACFDGGKSAWRKSIYPDYKANRTYGSDPEEKAKYDALFKQINTMYEFLPQLGVHCIKEKSYEADDIMYAVCKTLPGNKLVISSDKDFLQLVSEDISVYNLHKDKIISPLNFYEEMKIPLEAYMGYRALLGDPSDNIPGVPGIGNTTAKKLMDKYGHIDNVLNPSPEAKKELMKSARTKKIFDKENLHILGRNHRLMNFKYVDYSDIKERMENHLYQELPVNSEEVKNFLMKYQFISILSNYTPFILSFRSVGADD